MKTQDIRELTEAEIEKKLRDTREEYLNLNLRKQTGQVEHPHQFGLMRREIARMETVLREKQSAAAEAKA